MQFKFSGFRRLAAGAMAAMTTLMFTPLAFAEVIGQPVDKGIAMQPAATQIRADQIWFHNTILLPIITVISLFVLALLLICIVRFNHRTNPTPARWSHNTPVEIAWTIGPVLILMVVAIFSTANHSTPNPSSGGSSTPTHRSPRLFLCRWRGCRTPQASTSGWGSMSWC